MIKKYVQTYDQLLTKDEGRMRQFILITLLAILIRLLLLPFFGHIDFFSEYRRIFHLYENGNLFLGSRFVTAFTEYLNFSFWSPLIAEKSSMFRVEKLTETTASHLQFFAFVNHHAIFRTFLLLKLPYLIFDVGIGIALYHFFKNKQASIRAICIWFFNPITLFSFYIFARFESIPLFYLCMGLFFLNREQPLWASLFLGLSIWAREINVTILPFVLIYIFRTPVTSWTQRFGTLGIIGIFFGLASNVIPNLLGMHNQFRGSSPETIGGFDQALSLIGFNFQWYYPFVIAYVFIAIWLFTKTKLEKHHLFAALAIYYCTFFLMVTHSVHYVAWAVLVFSIIGALHPRFIAGFAFFSVTWIAYWMVATDLGVFTQWLAIPSSLFFSNMPNIPALLDHFVLSNMAFKLHHVIRIFHSIYAAGLIYCAILIFKFLTETKPCKD